MTIATEIRVADEIWIALALLHREHPDRPDFSVNEIVQRAITENLAGVYRQGLQMHASHHCVAQKAPNPVSTRHRMLTETGRGRRRLFRPGDAFHPDRKDGKVTPEPEDLPSKYRKLRDWYREEYVKKEGGPKGLRGTPSTVLLEFAGSIDREDVRRMERVIEEECEQIDEES